MIEETMSRVLGDLQSEVAKLRKENIILRGMIGRVGPCRHCGTEDITQCPVKFSGCVLADEIYAEWQKKEAEG